MVGTMRKMQVLNH